MEIKTKFNVGDHVCGINYQHKIVAFEVAMIVARVEADNVEIDYYPSDGKGGYEFTSFPERYCFAAKEEALAYIKGK